MVWLSGAQKGDIAPSVPSSCFASAESNCRTHKEEPFSPSEGDAVNTINRPLGEMLGVSDERNDQLAGGGILKVAAVLFSATRFKLYRPMISAVRSRAPAREAKGQATRVFLTPCS